MDPQAPCAVFNHLDRELWLVTARDGTRRGGLIATFVSQASLCPLLPGSGSAEPPRPRILAGLARQHFTHELVEARGAFALHLLAEEQLDWVWRFGLETGRGRDKLAGLAVVEKATGSPILADAPAWLDCRVEARLETGDRTLYLAEIRDGALERPVPVLTVKKMLERAPAERLRRLKELLDRDSRIDGAAVQAWRERT